jgi:hypothetical protein
MIFLQAFDLRRFTETQADTEFSSLYMQRRTSETEA